MRLPLQDLLPNTQYAIQLRAVGYSGTSEWSRRYVFTTIADTVNPDLPINVTWNVSGDSFHAEWDAVTTNEQGSVIPITRYEIELVASGVTKIDSVVPATGSTKVTYDLNYEMNRALFNGAKPIVTFRVRAVDNKELKSGWTPVMTATNTAPAAPAPATATASASAVIVSWPASVDTDISHYNVYAGTTSNFTADTASRVFSGNATKFTYTTLTYTATYFKVRAVDRFGQESPDAATGAATPSNPFVSDTTAPAVPSALAATITNNTNGIGATAALTWTHTAESDLAGFSLRYKRPADSSWLQVNYPKDARSATVDLNFAYSAYDFQIAAYDSSANYSAWSAVLSKAAVANVAPANVGTITLSPSRDSIAASWPAVADADLAGYEVTISTSSTFASGNSVFNTASNSHTFSGLSPSTQYYVRARAMDRAGLFSAAYSATANTTTLAFPATPLSDGAAPASSPTPTVTPGIGNLFVQWAPVVNNDLVNYEVHISVTDNFTPNAGTKAGENMGTFVILENTAGGTPLAYGTTYYVKLIAKDKDGSAAPGAQGSGAPLKVTASDSTLTAGDVGAATPGYVDDVTDTVNYNNQQFGFANPNPSFLTWYDGQAHPVHYNAYGVNPTRETVITKRGTNAPRFNLAAGTEGGLYFNTSLPNVEYVTAEVEVYLVSGTFQGAGLIVDWQGLTPTYRTQYHFADAYPTPETGKWYTFTKVFKRPTTGNGTMTSLAGYLMAGWSGLGSIGAKNIIFDKVGYRQSTLAEIDAYNAISATGAINTKLVSWTASDGISLDGADLFAGSVNTPALAANAVTANKLNVVMGGGNLLSNSGFEDIVDYADDWIVALPEGASGTRNTTITKNSAASLKATNPNAAGGSMPVYRDVTGLTPGDKYTLSAWVYITQSGTNGAAWIDTHDTGEPVGAQYTTGALPVLNSWQRIVVKGIVGTTGAVRCHLWTAPGATVYWDNAQLELGDVATAYAPKTDEVLPGTIRGAMIKSDEVDTIHLKAKSVKASNLDVSLGGENVLRNSSFQDGMSYFGPNLSNTIAASTTQKLVGTQSAIITAVGTSNSQGIYQSVTGLLPNTKYTFSLYYYIPTTNGVPRVLLYVYNGTTYVGEPGSVVGKWERLSYTFTTDASGIANVYALIDPAPANGQVFYTDAWKLEQGEVATSYSPKTDEILPGTIRGEHLEANTALIKTLNVGTGGFVQSDGYNPAGTSGFRLSNTELTMKSGTVYANTLVGGTGIINNLVINPGGAIQSSNFDANNGFQLSTTGLTIRGNGVVAVEAVQGGTISTKTINLGTNGNINLNGGVIQTNATPLRGIEIKSTGVKAYTNTGVETFSIDSATGNVEIKAGGTLTSPFINVSTGGSITGTGFSLSSSGLTISNTASTSIDGGVIKTGSIHSNTTTLVNGVTEYVWNIPLSGQATFTGARILGDTVIGRSVDDATTILQSANYEPGVRGWRLPASGPAEFLEVKAGSFSGQALAIDSVNAEALSTGTMTADISLSGSFETAAGMTVVDVTTVSGSPYITTVSGDFYLDDVGVTVVGPGIPVSATIVGVVLAAPGDRSSKEAILSINASASGTIEAEVNRGRRVNISGAGVVLRNAAGEVTVSLPTDPAETAQFTGSLTATDLYVLDDFRMFGLNNSLGQGSLLTLNGGSYKPTTAPNYSTSWDQVGQFLDPSYAQPQGLQVEYGSIHGYAYDYYASGANTDARPKYYATQTFYGQYIKPAWGFNVFLTHEGQKLHGFNVNSALYNADDWLDGGIATDANSFSLLTRNNVNNVWRLQTFTRASLEASNVTAASRTAVVTWPAATADSGISGKPAFTFYNGNTYVAKRRSTDNYLVLYKYTGKNLNATPAIRTVLSPMVGDVSSIQVGTFDMGSVHVAVTMQGNSTGNRATYMYAEGTSSFTVSKHFLSPYGQVPYGSVWRGTDTNDANGYFQTILGDGRIYKHTALGANETALTVNMTQRWRNDGSGGGIASISAEGPIAAGITYRRRSKLNLSTQSNIPDTGGNSPNAVSFYVGIGSGTRFRYPEQPAGVKTLSITSFMATDAPGPTTEMNNGVPSKLIGNNMEITGDGDAQFNTIGATNHPFAMGLRTGAATSYTSGPWAALGTGDGQILRGGITYNLSTGSYTVPVAGIYNVAASVLFVANSTGGRGIAINAGGKMFYRYEGNSIANQTTHISVNVYLNAGDVIAPTVKQDSGGSLAINTNTGNIWLTITKIA